ncbi:hypothetical protein AB3G34_01050 [Flavobacterium sp. WC2409]|uniref:Uncharacterized protein n=1 Tax=Flavobacterium sp. WC2409 TaxID=3234139 RepID=A0AB39W3R2_9FLAO
MKFYLLNYLKNQKNIRKYKKDSNIQVGWDYSDVKKAKGQKVYTIFEE